MKRLAIIGGGAWGTALAIVLAPRFEHVCLWVFEGDVAQRLQAERQNDT
ncbi:MAG: glycerol-3-phosphate dehydrogenase, partial [Bryobacteraceae bacterium]